MDTFMLQHTHTQTEQVRHIPKHTLLLLTLLFTAQPVSPQVVERRVTGAGSQDAPVHLGSSRHLPPCAKMIMTTPAAPRPQRTSAEGL